MEAAFFLMNNDRTAHRMDGHKIRVRYRNTSPISHMNGKRNKGLSVLCVAIIIMRPWASKIAR